MNPIRSEFLAGAVALAVTSTVWAEEQAAAAPGTNSPGPAVSVQTNTQPQAAVRLEGTDLHLGNLPPISFHGFASQGFLYSSSYNYLDPHTTDGSLKFFEAGVNASMNPLPHTRIAVQGFSYDVGDVGKYDPVLDYALAEYTFNDYLGVRGGRIRRPQGIYNDIQDVDLARTFVLLPQGIYDARWRDFYCSLDGGELFGTTSLGKAGSLNYAAYAGLLRPQMNGGIAQSFANGFAGTPMHLDGFNSPADYGMQAWWNTPINGLRAGYGFSYTPDFEANLGGIPFAGKGVDKIKALSYQPSLEYVYKNWTFQAEYLLRDLDETTSTRFGTGPTTSSSTDAWYVSAAYRVNKWLETGTYYTEYYGDTHNRSDSKLFQKDLALTFRFDPTSWWIIKVEGHYLNGTGLLQDNTANPVAKQDGRGWYMLALKTTFSF